MPNGIQTAESFLYGNGFFFAVSSYAIIEEITLAIFLYGYVTRTYVWKCAEILKYSLI